MKPVVSSIVALAIAIAPMTVFAGESSTQAKAASAKVAKRHRTDAVAKSDKADKDAESKTDKCEKSTKVAKADAADKGVKVEKVSKVEKVAKADKTEEKSVVTRVNHLMKGTSHHHAHGVEVGGAGHHEPKMVDHGGALIPASLMAPSKPVAPSASKKSHGKPEMVHVEKASAHESTAHESTLPKLPNPNAGKATASKSGAEKGAGKPSAEKKAESSDDGLPERDEELAELVAQIRGLKHGTSSSPVESEEKSESKARRATDKADTSDASDKGKLKRASAKTCTKDPVEVIRGPETETFELTRCDGTVAPLAVEHLSVLVRPGSAARPTAPITELAKKKGPELAHGIHRVDERLAQRLQLIVDHFAKTTGPAKVSVVSGYRPTSIGSLHSSGRAVDFRLEGAKNEDVVAFCKTLTDTGCGFYPNSSFVHVDVRDPGTGHVVWIDASGPGETPRYVASWPPPEAPRAGVENASAKEPITAVDRELDAEPEDPHPATVEP